MNSHLNKLLIVGNDPVVLDLIGTYVSTFGYSYDTAADGIEAANKLKEDIFSIVLTDIEMPNLDGMQLVKHIRKDYPNIDALVIADYKSINYPDAIRAGASEYISKPFSADELEAKLNRVVKQQNLIQKLEKLYQAANSPKIMREIEFKPEHKQAGLSILNYFGTIVDQKYKDELIKVKIEQCGLNVTMIIETPNGELKEKVEKTLEEYGLVVRGYMPLSEFFGDNQLQIMKLQNELAIAKVQLENQRRLFNFQEAHIQEVKNDLKEARLDIKDLRNKIGDTLSSQIQINEKLLELFGQVDNQRNDVIRNALDILRTELQKSPKDADECRLKDAFEEIQKKSPDLYSQVGQILINFVTSTASGVLVEMPSWINLLSKVIH